MRRASAGLALLALTACQVVTGLDRLDSHKSPTSAAPMRWTDDLANPPPVVAQSGRTAAVGGAGASGSAAGAGGSRTEAIAGQGGRGGAPSGSDVGRKAPPSAGDGMQEMAGSTGSPVAAPPREQASAGASAMSGDTSPAERAGIAGREAPAEGAGGSSGGAATEPGCTPAAPSGAACDTWPQCGCPQSESCAFYGDNLACVAAGSAGLNQACNDANPCQAGLQCANGACLRLCDQTHPDCEHGGACSPLYGRTDSPLPGGYVCESNCNLANPQRESGALQACGPGLQCLWWGSGTRCAKSSRGVGRQGQYCNDAYDCAPGYACQDTHTCSRWCVNASDCASGFRCEQTTDVEVGGTRFGLCKPNCLNLAGLACGLYPQCGCDANLSCDTARNPQNQPMRACRISGAVQAYAACTHNEDCIGGTSCVGGRCEPLCALDLDCSRFASCMTVVATDLPNSPEIRGLYTCTPACDPSDPFREHGIYRACAAGSACQPASDGRSYCRDANARGTWGARCQSDGECASGYVCVTNQGCAPLCRGNYDCSAGACSWFNTPLYAATVEYGACLGQ